MSKAIWFLIRRDGPSGLAVQWLDEFGCTGTPVHEYLTAQIGLLRGVNRATPQRYEIQVDIVERVRADRSIAAEIQEFLETDPELQYQLRRTLELESVQVVVNNVVK